MVLSCIRLHTNYIKTRTDKVLSCIRLHTNYIKARTDMV